MVRYTREGDKIEVVMGPPPAPAAKITQAKPDPQANRREHYEVMLNRPVDDKELEMFP